MDDDFEDEYFDDELGMPIQTSAMKQPSVKPKSEGSKTIQTTRKQQELAKRMGKKFGLPDLPYGKNLTLPIKKDKSLSSGLPGINTDPKNMPKPPLSLGKGARPGFFDSGTGPGKLDVNVHIMKEHEKANNPLPTMVSNEKLKYKVSKHVEHNRDLYFVRLVAGAMKRSFESMINVEQRDDTGEIDIKGKVLINVKYFYTNELLHGWATVIEKVKLMINKYMTGWNTTEEIHEQLISTDTTCVAFARYVAFIIMKESNNLVPRNRSRYVINDDSAIENELVLNLMKALNVYGVLQQELATRYL